MSRYFISLDKLLLKPETIKNLLQDQSWSKNIPVEYVKRFIEHSFCVGAYLRQTQEQVGFVRVITDYTTYAYHTDLVVDPQHQRQGLASQLVETALNDHQLQGLKTISLRVCPLGKLIYEKKGFQAAIGPETILEKENLNIYTALDFKNIHQETTCKTYSKLK